MGGHEGADVVDADVHGEQAPGAQVAGVGRDHRGGQVEDVEQAGGLQRAGPAEGAQRQVPHVDAPRRTVAWRMALAWFQVQISTMPSAHASGLRPTAAARASIPARAAPTSSGISPPSRWGGMRPSTRAASVSVGSVPPRP